MLNISSIKKVTGDSAEMRDLAARICRDYLHGGWKKVTAHNIGFKHISGGLSNLLYHVSLPEDLWKESRFQDEPREVLIRVYGQTHGEGALEALITESVVFTLLSERNLGPKLHGIFPGGRIEQYINARPLLTEELADEKLSAQIAQKMATIHSMQRKSTVRATDVPIWAISGPCRLSLSAELPAGTIRTTHTTTMTEALDEEQVKLLKRAFSMFDSSKKGNIEKEKVRTILTTLGHTYDDSELDALLEGEDPEQTGTVNFDSFCRVAGHFLENEDDEALQKELKEAFRLYDKEGNGYIPTSSLREILAALDDQLTGDQLNEMIAEIDTDSSGTVDFEEFMEMMTGD